MNDKTLRAMFLGAPRVVQAWAGTVARTLRRGPGLALPANPLSWLEKSAATLTGFLRAAVSRAPKAVGGPMAVDAAVRRETRSTWGLVALLAVLAVAGLMANKRADRIQAALEVQQKAMLAGRQFEEWLARQRTALTGLAQVGRGFIVMLPTERFAEALPDADTVAWWDHYAQDGQVVISTPGFDGTWMLAEFQRRPIPPTGGTELAVIDVESETPALLLLAAEPAGDSPWQIVVGAAFDLKDALAGVVGSAPQLADATLRVRTPSGAVVATPEPGADPTGPYGTATIRLGPGTSLALQVADDPARAGHLQLGADDLLFTLVLVVGVLLGVKGTSLARQRHRTTLTLHELAASGDRHRRVLEASSDAVFRMDTDGCIRWANGAARALLAVADDTLVGRPWRDFLLPAISADFWQETGLGPGAPPSILTRDVGVWQGRRTDGSLFVAEVLTAISTGADPNQPRELTAFVRDVTETLQLEVRAHRAENFQALGRLAGGVAHDFNNVLTAIRGRAELLLTPGMRRDRRDTHVAKLTDAIATAQDLVANLLAFARNQPKDAQGLDLNACVQRHVAIVRDSHCRHATVDVDLADDLPAILGDPAQIGQVVLNLCVNAGQATPAGGTITVRTAADAGGRAVVLEVCDTGAGIPAEHLPHLFEPFYTTKQNGGGSGLGLATVYRVVQGHGGDIAVDSTPGAGTQFTIRFPAQPANGAAAAELMVAGPNRRAGSA